MTRPTRFWRICFFSKTCIDGLDLLEVRGPHSPDLHVYRLTTAFHPPPVVVKQEQFHCETLHLLYFACRLLVLHRALSFVHVMDQRDRRWVHTQNPKDLNISIIWGSDALSTADAILTTFCSLSERDRRCLSAAPDIIFTLTTLAAAFVFIVKFRSLQDYGIEIAGVHNELLWVVVDRMTDVALHAEHAPAKYAKLITSWMRKWENAARNSDTGAAASTSAPACGSRSQPLADSREANSSTHPDFYLDEAFWSSFINPFSFPQDGELCPLRLNHSLTTTELFRYLSLPATPFLAAHTPNAEMDWTRPPRCISPFHANNKCSCHCATARDRLRFN